MSSRKYHYRITIISIQLRRYIFLIELKNYFCKDFPYRIINI